MKPVTDNQKTLPLWSHGGNRQKFAAEYGLPEKAIIDFSSNINPLGMPPKTARVIRAAVPDLAYYPDPLCVDLHSALAKSYGLPVENILAGNGSVELIYLLVRVLQPKTALLLQPNFSEYRAALARTSCQLTTLTGRPENNFKLPLAEIMAQLPGHDILFLSSPNNPAGYVYSQEELWQLLQACSRQNTYLFVDEAFADFLPAEKSTSLLPAVAGQEYLLVLRSLTKIFALPGIRLGFIAASASLVNALQKEALPWSVNSLAQKLGQVLPAEKKYLAKSRAFVARERKYLTAQLAGLPLRVFASEANYLLCQLANEPDLSRLLPFLAKKAIMIRDCSNYEGLGPGYFRIAVRSRKENRKLIKQIKKYFLWRS